VNRNPILSACAGGRRRGGADGAARGRPADLLRGLRGAARGWPGGRRTYTTRAPSAGVPDCQGRTQLWSTGSRQAGPPGSSRAAEQASKLQQSARKRQATGKPAGRQSQTASESATEQPATRSNSWIRYVICECVMISELNKICKN